MHLPTPDPGFTSSAQAHANFRLAATLALAFVALLWLLQIANWTLGVDAGPFGVRPRALAGLVGIVFAPLAHAGFEHLLANTVPLAVLGTAMLHLYPRSSPVVLPWVWLAPGVAVWLFGRDAIHLGASGLIYGLTAYVFVAGLLRRDRRAIAASLVVAFLYGGAVWGVMPLKHGDSWETHLAAALVGAALALPLRHRDVPPRVVYSYEAEAPEESAGEAPPARVSVGDTPPAVRLSGSNTPLSTTPSS
jgi:membrane associated rhomboid family serine protease